MKDMLARKEMPTLLRARSDVSLYEGQEIIDWPALSMADGDVVDEPGHGRYQTRYFERDANRGRTAR
jgi:hypothetical protein